MKWVLAAVVGLVVGLDGRGQQYCPTCPGGVCYGSSTYGSSPQFGQAYGGYAGQAYGGYAGQAWPGYGYAGQQFAPASTYGSSCTGGYAGGYISGYAYTPTGYAAPPVVLAPELSQFEFDQLRGGQFGYAAGPQFAPQFASRVEVNCFTSPRRRLLPLFR